MPRRLTKHLTTADVPPQFLETAYLVGRVPQRALESDPRISYTLYIPPNHYNPDPSRSSTEENATVVEKLPLLVYVHSTKRDFSAVYGDLVDFADSTPCAVLAPLFPACIEGPHDLDSYKLLQSATLRSDQALLGILDEVKACWLGIDTEKVFMLGCSGGGQFVHRFLYLHPERLAAVSIGAPGRVTFLDNEQDWPKGVADVGSRFGKAIRKELIRQVSIQLVVGGADVSVHGSPEFWAWLGQMRSKFSGGEQDAKENKEKGLSAMVETRLSTARKLHVAWKQDDIEAAFEVIEGIAHSQKEIRGSMIEFLRREMQHRT